MRRSTRTVLWLLAAVTTLLLAACTNQTTPPNVQVPEDPSYTAAESMAALEQTADGVTRAATKFGTGEHFAALGSYPGALPGGTIVLSSPTLSDFAVLALDELERGTYTWDTDLNDFTYDGADVGDKLIYRWPYDFQGDERQAELTIEYVEIEIVPIDEVDSFERAVETSISLSGDGKNLGKANLIVEEHDDECAFFIPIPALVDVDGFVGSSDNRLTVDAELTTVEEAGVATIASNGEISLDAGGHKAGADWEVTVTADVERNAADCAIESVQLDSIAAEVGLSAYGNTLGAFVTADVGYHADGYMNSFSIDGGLRVNDELAFTVAGTYSEEGGDEIVFTFAGEESMNFEEFLAHLSSLPSTTIVLSTLNVLP